MSLTIKLELESTVKNLVGVDKRKRSKEKEKNRKINKMLEKNSN